MSSAASSRFSSGLNRLQAASGKAQPVPVVPLAPEPVEAAPVEPIARQQQPSRVGKVNISGYFDPAVRRQINLLAAEHDVNKAELLAEALNLLFEKYGRSPIAKA